MPEQLPQSPAVLPNKKKPLLWIVLLIIVFVIVGYFLLMKEKPGKPEENQIERFFTLDKIVRADIPQEKLLEYRQRMANAKTNNAGPDGDINFRSYMEAASVKKGVGDYEGARDIWEYVNVKRPKNSVSFANLGDLYANFLKDPLKAEQNYLKAIENDPSDPGYVRNLLELYEFQIQNKLGFSEHIFQQAVDVNPQDADFWLLFAHYEELAKNYDKAVGAWERVKALEPSHKEVAEGEIARIKNIQ